MWVYENLEICIGGVFAAGVAEHLLRRWRHRWRYRILREAYERAVRQVQATDCDPVAVVRCTELERDFLRAWWLPWTLGLGSRIRKILKICVVLTLLAFVLRGPLERDVVTRSSTQAYANSMKRYDTSPGTSRAGKEGARVASRRR